MFSLRLLSRRSLTQTVSPTSCLFCTAHRFRFQQIGGDVFTSPPPQQQQQKASRFSSSRFSEKPSTENTAAPTNTTYAAKRRDKDDDEEDGFLGLMPLPADAEFPRGTRLRLKEHETEGMMPDDDSAMDPSVAISNADNKGPFSSKERKVVSVEPYPGVGKITVVSLNGPPMNTLTLDMLAELRSVLRDLDDSDETHLPPTDGIILTNALPEGHTLDGGADNVTVFSGGLEITELIDADAEQIKALWLALQDTWLLINCMQKPVVAAINGSAIGFGLLPAIGCDMRVGLDHSSVALAASHGTMGLVMPPWFMSQLAYIIGTRRAERLLLTCDLIDAKQAHAMGLLDSVKGTPEEVMAEAHAAVHKLLAIPQTSRDGVKTMMRHELLRYLGTDVEREYDAEFFSTYVTSGETQTAMRTFLESLSH